MILELLSDLASMGRCRDTHRFGPRCEKEAGHCGQHKADGEKGSAGTHVYIWPGSIECPDRYERGPFVEEAV